MDDFFLQLRKELGQYITFLNDKPEETVDSTLKALWHKASGAPMSADKANQLPLPILSPLQKDILLQLIQKRKNGIPLAHLTGRQNFMGIEFKTDDRALIPRKETEILGRTALEICHRVAKNKQVINIFDVCCGAGNLGLAIACLNSNVKVYASDISPQATELTQENINLLNLNQRAIVTQSDLFKSFETEKYWNQIDMIVCNPPYISTSKVAKMNAEIALNEPALAFDGGMMGIKVIQKLIKESPKFLAKNGCLVFEVGLGQGPFAIQLCEKSGTWQSVSSTKDASGNIRVIAACRND